jgi:hypothetical protein
MVYSLTVTPDERLVVGGGYNTQYFLLALDPDGSLSE